GAQTALGHRPQDAAVDRLQTIAGIGEGPGDDDRHRVLEERLLHLALDLDRLDRAGDERVEGVVGRDLGVGATGRARIGRVGWSGVVPRFVGGLVVVGHQMSRNLTSLALVWMKCLRLSTSSPIRIEKTASAIVACSAVTWSSVRRSGSIVVAHSSSAS